MLITLLDRIGKKIRFLNNVCATVVKFLNEDFCTTVKFSRIICHDY